MLDIRENHPLSQVIYEGVLEKPPWKSLLKELEEYMQVASATLVLRRPKNTDPGLAVYLYSDSDLGALDEFQSRGYVDSPFAELSEKKVFTLEDRVTVSEQKSLDFYSYLKAYNVLDLIGFDVYDKQSDIRLRLRLVRMLGSSKFSEEDRKKMESIVPLMDKALTLYSAYAHNSFVREFYEELLASMDIASLIINENMEVLSLNARAEQILSSSDGLFLRREMLHCNETSDQKKLRGVCRDLLKSEAGLSASSFSIGRTKSDTKWDVSVRSLAKNDVSFDEGGPEFVILIKGATHSDAPSQTRLMEVFGVTPAESRLMTYLIDGLTLTAAAEALGVSRNTARAQLSSVFRKTGVNRQTQLVKLVSDAFSSKWH